MIKKQSSIKSLIIILFINYQYLTVFANRIDDKTSDYSKIMGFLVDYRYINQNDLQSNELRSDDYLHNAIRKMQKYGGLKITGKLNNETLELIGKRRCGNPDIEKQIYSTNDDSNIYLNRFRRDLNNKNSNLKYLKNSEKYLNINYKNIKLNRERRYALNNAKWPNTKIKWSINSWPKQMTRTQVTRILQSAFKIWSDSSRLEFQQVSSGQKAEIKIEFLSGNHGDNFPFDGEGKVLAHAFSPSGGDVHFDLDENWVEDQTADDEENGHRGSGLFSVSVHEIGHALGLSHSTVYGSLMFPYYQKFNLKDFKLPQDDTQGIQLLYGSKEQTRWTPVNLPSTPLPPKTQQPSLPSLPKTQLINKTEKYPNICTTGFDSIANIRGELFFFKNKYFWRLIDENKLERDYPVEIKQFFKFPRNIDKIDAVYERPLSKKIIFFINDTYYEFTGNRVDSGFPKSIQNLGFSKDVKKIIAAIVWSYNGKTYFFGENGKYWRFNELEEKIEIDYPRDMSVWRGIPTNLDAAFTFKADGLTYFTLNNRFFKFKNSRMKTLLNGQSELISKNWFNNYC